MDISVIIPTRERRNSLKRLLTSLKNQPFPLNEIIIVDSSKARLDPSELQTFGFNGEIRYYHTTPSVTAQRNLGIQTATSDYVFLCDDDMEVPPDYLPSIYDFLKNNPEIKVISGMVAEKIQNEEFCDLPEITMKGLIWNTIFQLGVWTDMNRIYKKRPHPVMKLFQLYYKILGNRLTSSGYPLVTQIKHPYFTTALYGFGAAVVNRNWLLQHPYDEILDEYGIGDHYRIALQLPPSQQIVVLTTTRVYHHKSDKNRPDKSIILYRRLLTLDYIFKTSGRFSILNRISLLWSILGQWITYIVRNDKEMKSATKKAFRIIATGKNPYVLAKENGLTGPVNPTFSDKKNLKK